MAPIRPVHLTCLVTGTDTGVGKTHVTCLLAQGLRSLSRRVWLHKPVVSGIGADDRWEDLERLTTLVQDGQDPGSLCPHRLREPAAPSVAARHQRIALSVPRMAMAIAALTGDHDLLVEGVGGLLVPLDEQNRTVRDLALTAGLDLLIVTRPDLGTLNHTTLTVEAARTMGREPLGLVLNHAHPAGDSLAIRTVKRELETLTGLPVMAEIPCGDPDPELAPALARTLLAVAGQRGRRCT